MTSAYVESLFIWSIWKTLRHFFMKSEEDLWLSNRVVLETYMQDPENCVVVIIMLR